MSAKLRLLEHYYSMQGEGPRVGVPTQFVRFAGCNLRCPGWPCDTPYAIEPKLYRTEQHSMEPDELSREIQVMCIQTGAGNVCLTGGEPLLQNKDALESLVLLLREAGHSVEMFSNGTFEYSYFLVSEVDIVMDWKLPGSGDSQMFNDIVHANSTKLRTSGRHAFKFTVASEDDLLKAKQVYEVAELKSALCPTYVGPVWGKIDPARVVDFVRFNRLDWRLNLQVHKYIWDPDARGT
jgi:7-carboxy-7-deazaguanine synthase